MELDLRLRCARRKSHPCLRCFALPRLASFISLPGSAVSFATRSSDILWRSGFATKACYSCDACAKGLVLDQQYHKCVKSCPLGYTADANGVCVACFAGCTRYSFSLETIPHDGCLPSCTSSGTCTACAENRLMLLGTCTPSCPQGFSEQNGACICASHAFLSFVSDSTRVLCAACVIPGCQTCYDGSCLTCSGSLLLLNNQCVNSCPSPGYVAAPGVCLRERFAESLFIGARARLQHASLAAISARVPRPAAVSRAQVAAG